MCFESIKDNKSNVSDPFRGGIRFCTIGRVPSLYMIGWGAMHQSSHTNDLSMLHATLLLIIQPWVGWYGNVLRRDDDYVFRRVLDFAVNRPKKRGRPKKLWKNQVEDEMKRI